MSNRFSEAHDLVSAVPGVLGRDPGGSETGPRPLGARAGHAEYHHRARAHCGFQLFETAVAKPTMLGHRVCCLCLELLRRSAQRRLCAAATDGLPAHSTPQAEDAGAVGPPIENQQPPRGVSISRRLGSAAMAASDSDSESDWPDTALIDNLLEPVGATLRLLAAAEATPGLFRSGDNANVLYLALISAPQIDAVYASFQDGYHRMVHHGRFDATARSLAIARSSA